MRVICPYCDRDAKLVTGNVIYPHRADLQHLKFWHCSPCDAYVGCHKAGMGQGDGTRPLGRLANAQLRKAKQAAHAAFDPLWKSGRMSRKEAYIWLAGAIGVSHANCHIGMFDIDACKAVKAAVEQLHAAR